MKKYKAHKKQVDEFYKLAVEFCELLEQHRKYKKHEFVMKALRIIPRLYQTILDIPNIDEKYADYRRETYPTTSPVKWRSLGKKFGKHEVYWMILDPFGGNDAFDTTPFFDFSDTYSDLHQGIKLYEEDPDEGWLRAAYYWREWFILHYGYHLADLMKVLFWIARDAEFFDD